jgi:hypothetical protein
LIYGGIGLVLAVPAMLAERRPGRATGRALVLGLVLLSSAVCVSAVQLLPMLSYLQLTNRGKGLPLAIARLNFREVTHPLPSEPFLVLVAAGAAWLWREGRRGVALWLLAACVLSLATATVKPVYAFLWQYTPGFRYQRIPQRAFALLAIAGPPLAAVGLQAMENLVPRRPRLSRWLALVLAGWLVWGMGDEAPGTPPMASPTEEAAANHTLGWLADHAGGARVHIWESHNRLWGCDHMTVRLGLEVAASYTPSDHHDYLPSDFDPPTYRSYLGDSYRRPAVMWGMLSIRYVTSLKPHDEPGLRLAAEPEGCPLSRCQPAKCAGLYIYENEKYLPRAYQVPAVIVMQGQARPVFEAALYVEARRACLGPAREAR